MDRELQIQILDFKSMLRATTIFKLALTPCEDIRHAGKSTFRHIEPEIVLDIFINRNPHNTSDIRTLLHMLGDRLDG